MSEEKEDEVAKLALGCLKTRLDADVAAAESEKAMWDFLSNLATQIGTLLPGLLGTTEKKLPSPPQMIMLTKEDLMFFAKKAPLQDLEKLVKDLSDVAEARKQKAPPGP